MVFCDPLDELQVASAAEMRVRGHDRGAQVEALPTGYTRMVSTTEAERLDLSVH